MTAKKPEPFSRRELLFGFMDRIRGRDRAETAPTGLDSGLAKADEVFAQGKWSEALEAYRDSLSTSPLNDEARVRVGICFYRLEKHTQAMTELKAVLRKRPHNLASLYLGLTHARRGELDKTLAAWKAYFDPGRVALMREVNLQCACIEEGHEVDSGEVARAVENALEADRKSAADKA